MDGDAEETALSAYLAGQDDFPAGDLDFTRLWTIRGLIGGLALEERPATSPRPSRMPFSPTRDRRSTR